ncbi:chymotrypsin inhibitor-like [Mantella aurantiaca]
MKIRAILLLSLVMCALLIGRASSAPPVPAGGCPQNEEFVTCGSKCLTSCKSRESRPTMCDRMCYIGCDCKGGYLRHGDGNCVLPENCD